MKVCHFAASRKPDALNAISEGSGQQAGMGIGGRYMNFLARLFADHDSLRAPLDYDNDSTEPGKSPILLALASMQGAQLYLLHAAAVAWSKRCQLACYLKQTCCTAQT